MADKKISQLTGATTPLAGSEVLPIVQSGNTVKVSVDNLTTGKSVTASQYKVVSTTGTAETLIDMQTVWDNPSGNKSLLWKDATNALGRISVDYSAPTATMSFGSLYNSGYQTDDLLKIKANGHVDFPKTGQRITGDFSNATAANRVAVQTNVTNGATNFALLPNGTSTNTVFVLEGDSAQANGSVFTISCGANSNTEVRFNSNIRGTGSYLPITFFNAGAERFRIATTSGDVTVNTGNLVVGTAAKGIDFSANTGAAGETSSLLNWYEEGTWTPTLRFGGATTGITYTTQTGTYTRIGRMVYARATIALSSNGSASGGATVTGLPFNAAVTTAASIYQDGISYTGSLNVAVEGTVDRFTIQQVSEAGSNSNLDRTNFTNTANIFLSVCYQV